MSARFPIRLRRAGARLAFGAALLAVAAGVLLPLYLMAKYAVSDRASIVVPPGTPIPLWPHAPTLAAFRFLLGSGAFVESALLSLGIALATVALALLLGAPAAFALARHRIPFKPALLIALLSVRLFPDVAAAVPVAEAFLRARLPPMLAVSLVHTLLALPYVLYIAIGVFETIPRDLEEQAHILGAGRLYTLTRIVLPVALPGLAAAAIYAFLLSWNEFIFSYFLLFVETAQTLPVHLKTILSYSPQPNVLAAMSVLVSLPVVVFTFAVQRFLRAETLAGAVK